MTDDQLDNARIDTGDVSEDDEVDGLDYPAIRDRLVEVLDAIPADLRPDFIGKNESTIKRYRKRPGTIQLSTMARVAAKTGISLDWLVWGDGYKMLAERRALTAYSTQSGATPISEFNYLYYDEDMLYDMIRAAEEMAHREKWRPLLPEEKAKIVIHLYRHACREKARERGIDSHRLRMEADKALRIIYDILEKRK